MSWLQEERCALEGVKVAQARQAEAENELAAAEATVERLAAAAAQAEDALDAQEIRHGAAALAALWRERKQQVRRRLRQWPPACGAPLMVRGFAAGPPGCRYLVHMPICIITCCGRLVAECSLLFACPDM